MNDPILEKHCWAEIDLDALRHNFSFIKRTINGPVCAVVKADAYGHGDIVVARVLQEEGAAAFAVSCLAEAKRLRRHGITVPVLILGYADPGEAPVLAQDDIATACFSTEYARALSEAAVAAGVKVKVHLKIDTGMGRIGFAAQSDWQAVVRELESLYSLPGLEIDGIFQHFAVADSLDPESQTYTDGQYALFRKIVDQLQADGYRTGTVHCANSAAQLRHPEWRKPGPQRRTAFPGVETGHDPEVYCDLCKRPAARPECQLRAHLYRTDPHASGYRLCRLCRRLSPDAVRQPGAGPDDGQRTSRSRIGPGLHGPDPFGRHQHSRSAYGG